MLPLTNFDSSVIDIFFQSGFWMLLEKSVIFLGNWLRKILKDKKQIGRLGDCNIFMGILSKHATYVWKLQRVSAKGPDASGKEKKIKHLFSCYGNSYSLSAGTFFMQCLS